MEEINIKKLNKVNKLIYIDELLVSFNESLMTSIFVQTGVLWGVNFPAWLSWVTKLKVNVHGWTDCRLSYFLWFYCRQLSATLLAMMSVEKFIALYFPLRTRNICTVKTAKWASSIASVVLAIINIFWFFVIGAVYKEKSRNTTCRYKDFILDYILTILKVDGVISFWGPFAIMACCTSAIIYKFVQAKRAFKRGGTESTNQALGSAAMRGTAILIAVTITFMVLIGPANIILTMSIRAYPILEPILYVGIQLNHSINGVLYCIVGSKFRKELIKTLRCNRKDTVDTEGRTSMATSMTSVKSG